MKDILEALSVPLLLESIFHPFIALNQEIEAISLNKHRTRSSIKILIMAATAIVGIVFFYQYPPINQFFIKLIAAFNVSTDTQPLLSASLAILASCHVGSYVSNVIVRSTCNFVFGDPDFYVTKNRAIQLEQQFKDQGNYKITQAHIYEVVDFCRKNFRRQTSNELGTKPEDWKKTIESLLYDGDIEHFLDQQQALKMKKIELERKLEAIAAYAGTSASINAPRNSISKTEDQSTTAPTPKHQCSNTSKRTPRAVTNASSTAILSDYQITPTTSGVRKDSSSGSTESTPLLPQFMPCYSQNIPEIEAVAMQELKRFKAHHLRKERYYVMPSDECLLHHCKHHLQTIGLKTEKAIYPESLILKLSLLADDNDGVTGDTPITTPVTTTIDAKSPLSPTLKSRPTFS
jgi:hypothetical protein